MADAALPLLVLGVYRHQRHRRIAHPDIDRQRIASARAVIKQINPIAEIAFKADPGIDMPVKRQSRLGSQIVTLRKTLGLHRATVAPAAEGLIIIGGKAQILPPGFRSHGGAL